MTEDHSNCPMSIAPSGRQWSVTAIGIEANEKAFMIGSNQLNAVDWVGLMADKPWVDVTDFTTAWLVALVLHGVKTKQ
jgi:hypothetical protein